MRRTTKTFVTVLLVTSMLGTTVLAAPSTGQLQQQKNQATAEMESLENDLASIMTDINVTERKLITTGEAISEATAKLEEAESNEAQLQEAMKKRIVLMYKQGKANSNTFSMVFGSESLAEMLRNIQNAQAIHKYDREQLQKYIDTQNEIKDLKSTLESEQSALLEMQTELETKQQALSGKIAEKRAEVDNIQEKIDEAARLAAEEARRRAEQAERENSNNSDNKVVINTGGSNSSGGVQYTGSGDQSVGDAIVAAARTYLGVDYVWGGNGYDGIDCSGLTKAAHKAVGIYIDRWSGHQAIGGKAIGSVAEAKPGDIICYSGHVAIYIGNERVIHAPHTGTVVKEATVYLKDIIAIRRYW